MTSSHLRAAADRLAQEQASLRGYWDGAESWVRGSRYRDIRSQCVEPVIHLLQEERLVVEAMSEAVGRAHRALGL